MTNLIKDLIESRASINHYDTSRPIADDVIAELVQLATRAPSAYNFQNWKFIAVRSPQAKLRLQTVAYGQKKVTAAPVTFIICGTLAAHEQLPHALQSSVDTGILAQSVFEGWVTAAQDTHENNPQLQRDEAFRSASLAAMTLMLAAQGMGLSTGSMSGFDPLALAREFSLAETDIPVILVTAGYPLPNNWPQKPRKPLNEVIEFV
ncbi:MAG TPA: nitroreductase family protein [Thiobacillus sp.]